MNELCTKGAGELGGLIASGKAKSAEVVDAYLARIEEVNSAINAVTVTLADEARAAAAAVDRAVAAGASLGPLAGVPFTIKENIDVAGSATTWGVAALAKQAARPAAPVTHGIRPAPRARPNGAGSAGTDTSLLPDDPWNGGIDLPQFAQNSATSGAACPHSVQNGI